MPLNKGLNWPRTCGFEIYGVGPSYVVAVEPNSVASIAGLMPGDQLLELEGVDVSSLPSEQIKSLAKRSRNQYPAVEVVACLQEINILPNRLIGYGFTFQNARPLVVSTVDFGGPSYMAGLRSGDIILAINGQNTNNIEDIEDTITSKPGQLTLLTIPVGRSSNMVEIDKKMNKTSPLRRQDHRAKELHDKMNYVLGDEYEKKMAIVGILKQYAEDRDVHILGRALNAVLKTPQHRRILKQIRFLSIVVEKLIINARPFVPPGHRPKFDAEIKLRYTSPVGSDRLSVVQSPHPPSAHKTGHRKIIQVIRDDGSFGLVIKGSNPAYVESVDEGGPSEKAGIRTDDFIMKLNGLDVRKCSHSRLCQLLQESGSAPTIEILRCENGLSPSVSLTSVSSESSVSSHGSVDWLTNQHQTDTEGRTFQQRADFLLTGREKHQIRKAIENYEISNNVVDLHSSLAEILDSPSKKTLWMFIIARLPIEHQEYCLHRISLPQDILLECVNVEKYQQEQPLTSPRITYNNDYNEQSYIPDNLPTTFRQQLEFLLTPTERQQLKEILQRYDENKDINDMLEDIEVILDTPSKRSLWKYILPLIHTDHQIVVRQRLLQLQKYSRNTKTIKERNEMMSGSSSEDEKGSSTPSESSPHERLKVRNHNRSDLRSADKALVKELEETRKAIQEAKDAIVGKGQGHHGDDIEHEDGDSKRYVTIIPVGYPGLEGRPFHKKEMDSPELNRVRKLTPQKVSPASSHYKKRDTIVYNEVEHETKKFNVRPGDSFNQSAITALEELDAVMAAETSDQDSEKNRIISKGIVQQRVQTSLTPAPPPPPPVPPPPSFQSYNNKQMNVKRINWEKLNPSKVNNTVWQQIDDSELEDIVKYLELDQHFSTKTTKPAVIDKKQEVFILNPKKAYNISILLGHLKMSISDIKHAIYSMDEDILTPELLKQLLNYSPSKHEQELYDSFTGDVDSFSNADRFAYETSQIPNYEQRLKAMLFKASFKEKITEMKEHLRCIKAASRELRHSKKLAKILELILAMGNHMNKGNERVGDATGFRITFLSQIDITKTSDNKSTFLHVLTEAVSKRFPDVLSIGDDLTHVSEAAKVSNVLLNQELNELRKVLQDISDTLEKFNGHKTTIGTTDRFQEHFIAEASDELQSLFRLQHGTMEEFSELVQYFGEDPKKMDTGDLFGIFADFVSKFEKAHRENSIYKRH
ncbi:hypothetical protein LOTGIDRAFT_155476 [Lottia gigantea]|uniref:Delphilin n=1 Tax=Lottia gigantea TaxID=225164 RepID=V3ZTC4_LOTGI|nr:hypothetical protein LOTGIDRAFT_155476 [Lottia gigantea]ESO84151.1 hypothetical protein LOTGIDRAFT_155476 [Lottia gigantea]